MMRGWGCCWWEAPLKGTRSKLPAAALVAAAAAAAAAAERAQSC